MVAMGFSGGALFSTVVASQRGDTLAALVEMSGGADVEAPLVDGIVAPYETPSWQMPVYLASGGDSDIWPDSSFVIVDFAEATDTLQDHLVEDEHFVMRCKHDYGHTVTTQEFMIAEEWAINHRYGEPSPYETDGIGDWSSWCEVAE